MIVSTVVHLLVYVRVLSISFLFSSPGQPGSVNGEMSRLQVTHYRAVEPVVALVARDCNQSSVKFSWL